MKLKSKIILQVTLLCLILGVGACYLFLGTYRVQQKLDLFSPATGALIAIADVDSALASEQRMLWTALASGRGLAEVNLAESQAAVLEAFDRMLRFEHRQKELGVFGEDNSIAQLEDLHELYKLWQRRFKELLAQDPSGRTLTEPARMLIEDQLFPGLEHTAEHAVFEVQEAYADLEEALGFFPWMQAGARGRIREINAELAFVIGGNHVYTLLNRQFATLQAYSINGKKEDLGRFQSLFSQTEDMLTLWHKQAVVRLRLNVDDRQHAIDLDKVSAVEEGYSLLRDMTGDALLNIPAEEAGNALDTVVHQIEGLVQGRLRPAVMSSLKSGVESLRSFTTTANQVSVSSAAVVLMVIILLAIRSVRRMVRSLSVLQSGIETYQHGNLAHRVVLDGSDEFRELASSLNQMAEQLGSARREIEDLNQSLERKVDERTLLLEEANRELKAFNHMVSHDLRNPLTAVLGVSQVLLEKARRAESEDQVPLEHVYKGAEQIDLTITALLNLSNFSNQPLHYDVVDFSLLGQQVAADLQSSGSSFAFDCPAEGALKVAADPNLMRLVLETLMQNAIEHARPDRALQIEIGSGSDSRGPVFFIRDNGRGFDPGKAGELFAPFSRLHVESGITDNGIGLAIVQRIIHRHGGEIWADSVQGEGSCFNFTVGEPQAEGQE